MKTLLARFAKDESGATAIEYGLIATLISVMIIGGATLVGTSLEDMFQGLGETLSGTGGAGEGEGEGEGTEG